MSKTLPHSPERMCSDTVRSVRSNGRSQCRAAVAVAVLCFAVSALFRACRERRESFYPSLADAVKAGEITRGWIPDFLPESSRAVHVIYAAESPSTWCAFEFSPNDSQRLRKSLMTVDALPLQVKHIENPGVSWWPDFLEGDLDVETIHGHGFVLCVVKEPDVGNSTHLVLFAIDWVKGRGYFYRSPISKVNREHV